MSSDQTQAVHAADPRASSSDSLPGLVHAAISEASHLVSSEIQLAKQEIAESLRAAVTALVAGSLAMFAAVACLVMAIVAVVIAVPQHWLAALICAGVFLVITVVGATLAVRRVKRISPLRQTVHTLKEDVEWAKQQLTPKQR